MTTLKITLFWDVIECRVVDIYQCLGGIYYLHAQGGRGSQAWKEW
jgi:hypothetical protein